MHRFLLIAIFAAMTSLGIPASDTGKANICFPDKPDVSACFAAPFADYWQANGGLPVFGYPLVNAQTERNPDLNVSLLTQWTERNRLESHPEQHPPFDILLGRMGAERLLQLGRDPAQEGREPGPRAGCLWFETTGHNVCDQARGLGFRTYWEAHGLRNPKLDTYGRSLQLFGLPLTIPRFETNASGDTVLTQWFERARFEWHPEKPDEFKVLLGLLGSELRSGAKASSQPSVFGVEINTGMASATAAKAGAANVSWTRYNGILWSQVEPKQGSRDWSQLARFEREMASLTAQGLTPIVVVRGTPGWAQKVPGYECGPIKPEALDAFASFMRDLVTRYSRPPFGVRYWEIGNEPDVAASLVAADSPFGCWGDQADPYYGGGYFAEMLKHVYPAIKQANPSSQLITGGLLLDCDPTHPPAGKDCRPARFLDGILRNGGGSAFDIIAYHAYNYWSPGLHDPDRESLAWSHRGGALLGKLDFLNAVQAEYGIHKPLLMNEGGMICHPSTAACPNADFFEAQASYAVRLYSRAWANGLQGAIWFTLNGPGWREGGLLDRSQAPRPAYTTLKFVSTLLKDAVYTGPLGSASLEGYSFRRGGTTFRILWTNDGATVMIGLPPGTRAVYDRAGRAITPSGASMAIGFEPVVIEVGGS